MRVEKLGYEDESIFIFRTIHTEINRVRIKIGNNGKQESREKVYRMVDCDWREHIFSTVPGGRTDGGKSNDEVVWMIKETNPTGRYRYKTIDEILLVHGYDRY